MTKSFAVAVGLFAIVAVDGVASAQAVEWKVSEGGNGHWYALVPESRLWPDARDRAVALGGHLATTTSQAELDFLQPMMIADGGERDYFLGSRRDAVGSPWYWITGEPMDFTNWWETGGDPERLYMEVIGRPTVPSFGRWNSERIYAAGGGQRFFVEWEDDCNQDGIVDYGQCHDGTLADYNGNNVPDCCETGSTCTVGSSVPVQWRVEDGGNGHWYMMSYNEETRFFARQAMAASVGAHLTTLQTVDEHAFVFTVAKSQEGFSGSEGWPALGGFRAPNSDVWSWVTGEAFSYAPWPVGEPNGDIGMWAYIQMWGANGLPNLTIDDNTSMQSGECGINRRAMLEWDADCNGDGVVDFGQILRGELVDSDADGIPDTCEATIAVPAERPTIQAAIDAATTTRNIILVSEGTYNEAIDLKGKAITVKAVGARASTIIDGTGKTTSVVRAVTGETSATVLQGFTIRNGITGTSPSFEPSLRLGGGMYIDQASPTVKDCAFVSNRAGFGGGLYSLFGSPLIEGCNFSQNVATTDGGGLQLFGGSAVVRNCAFADNTATVRGGGLHIVQYSDGGAPTVDECTITGNRANVGEGGGMTVEPYLGASAKPAVSNCTIQGNTSFGRGGGLWGLVAPTAPGPNMRLTNNTICNNTSTISKRENVWALYEDGGNAICDCFSDIDGNRGVDNGDIAFTLLFIGELTDADFIQPDQDMSGFVDTGDVALVLLNFGPCQ